MGHYVSIWEEPWLPNNHNPYLETPVVEGFEDLTVANLLLNGE